jgi:hypothetical protein
MLISRLGRESEAKYNGIKNICSCATFKGIFGKGEIMFCLGAKGIDAPKESCVAIGNVWPGEVCVATEFHKSQMSECYYSINTEKMNECPYRKTDSK